MTILNATDLAGWSAAGLTLLTFVCKDMRHLRLLAIFANCAFITYGTLAGLVPILVLHMALVPINLGRLMQQLGSAKARSQRPLSASDIDAASDVRPPPRPWPAMRTTVHQPVLMDVNYSYVELWSPLGLRPKADHAER